MIKVTVSTDPRELTPAEQAESDRLDAMVPDNNRRRAYPAIGDQLDAIMKWVNSGDLTNFPSELKTVAARCVEVKRQNPK